MIVLAKSLIPVLVLATLVVESVFFIVPIYRFFTPTIKIATWVRLLPMGKISTCGHVVLKGIYLVIFVGLER